MPFEPYCGPSPVPATVWMEWNLDPLLIGIVCLAGALLMTFAPARRERSYAAAALFLLLIIFVSPLCALASALFSVRVGHHLVLVSCVAPLVVLSLGAKLVLLRRVPPQLVFLLHAVVLWFWHAPGAYAAALSSNAVYWLMQASLLSSAIWLWSGILGSGRSVAASLFFSLGTILQMGMLGALLTFARTPLFDWHLTTTQPFGLTPLEDQQLAGLIMWIPASVPYLAAAITRLMTLFPNGMARDAHP